jgi:23S rRNA (uracil1939-C5)-methyltransferase
MKLKFRKMGINGEGIGYIDHKPVFCDGVLPYEEAEIEITEKNKNYSRATLKKITWFSKERIRTDYEYYVEEGCPLFIMNYESQLKYKKQILEEALLKYANVKNHFVRDFHPSPLTLGYRSQCKLPVQDSRGHMMTGMYVPGTNHFHPIKRSLIQSEELENTRIQIMKMVDRSYLKAYDAKKEKGLRYLVLRVIDGEKQVTLVTGKDKVHKELIEEIMSIDGMTGVFQSINTDNKAVNIFGSATHKLAGEDTMPVTIGDITLQLAPEAFFQLNVQQAEDMYKMAVSKVDKCNTLVEAYCGVGAMSLLAHKKAKHIYGIESIQSAVENAKQNAERNEIENAEFICDDAAEGLKKIAKERNVDVLLVDPPRSGMDDKMLSAIEEALPKKIIYISCNPSTLAKNLKILKHNYHVVTIHPYDLFPHTPHIETITVLERDNYKKQEN